MPYEAASTVELGLDDVAIALGPGLLGSHLGVAFHLENGTPTLLDLAFHKLLRVGTYPGNPGEWSITTVPLPQPLGLQVLSMLRMFTESFQKTGHQEITYGVNLKLTEGSIGQNGEYQAPPGSDGHTCSTFIAELFRAARVALVKLDNWPDTEQNRAWGEAVVCMLKVYGKKNTGTQAVAQAKAVAKNVSGKRLLPEEVAAAGLLPLDQLPAEQPALVAPARTALAEMQAVCNIAAPGDYKHCVDGYRHKVVEIERRAAQATAQVDTKAQTEMQHKG